MTRIVEPFFVIEYRSGKGPVEYLSEGGELIYLSLKALRFDLRAEAQAVIDIHRLKGPFAVVERRLRSSRGGKKRLGSDLSDVKSYLS
jgi:hypothetical protein